jgi:peptidoglycan/xylan/chitin deacetylase (PgdA/CDA1 family)
MKKKRAKFRLEDYSQVDKKYKAASVKQAPIKTKKKPRKSAQSGFLSAVILISLFILVGCFLYFNFVNKKLSAIFSQTPTSNKTTKTSIKVTKAASTSSASPSSQPLHQDSGRFVRVPILYYHYIGNNPNPADTLRDSLSIAPDKFDEQMEYLSKNGYNTITFDTMYAGLMGQTVLPPKSVILTFDDGYIDFFVNAFPTLRKYNLKATVFIPTGLMDQGYYLHWNQIKEMDQTGLISFEAHSITHANLPSLSNEEVYTQITESKKFLEAQLGKPVNFMAYPYGTTTPEIEALVKKAGYIGSAGTWTGVIQSEGNLFDMPREKIGGNFTIEEFAARL